MEKGKPRLRKRATLMDEARLEDKLRELVKEFGGIESHQYKKLASLAQQEQDGRKRLQKSVDNLQESLDYLRICIKYQLFDLEATRRENKYLRKLLEEKDS
ncbi:MAG: hypothetical protein WBC22_12570 [Sedimentisphaerales bacterium]